MCYLKIRQSNREVRGLAVCHEYRLSWAARNCTRGEGGPFEFGNLLISSHREPLSSSDGSVDDGDDGHSLRFGQRRTTRMWGGGPGTGVGAKVHRGACPTSLVCAVH